MKTQAIICPWCGMAGIDITKIERDSLVHWRSASELTKAPMNTSLLVDDPAEGYAIYALVLVNGVLEFLGKDEYIEIDPGVKWMEIPK